MLAGHRRLNVLACLWHLGGWLCITPLVVIAGARVVAWDSRSILVGLNALTPLLFLPALAIGAIATARRRWVLTRTATLLMAADLSFALPEVLAAERMPSAASSAPSFRIFNANVFAGNDRVAGYAEEIRRARPRRDRRRRRREETPLPKRRSSTPVPRALVLLDNGARGDGGGNGVRRKMGGAVAGDSRLVV